MPPFSRGAYSVRPHGPRTTASAASASPTIASGSGVPTRGRRGTPRSRVPQRGAREEAAGGRVDAASCPGGGLGAATRPADDRGRGERFLDDRVGQRRAHALKACDADFARDEAEAERVDGIRAFEHAERDSGDLGANIV